MDTYIANIFVIQLASHDIFNKDIQNLNPLHFHCNYQIMKKNNNNNKGLGAQLVTISKIEG